MRKTRKVYRNWSGSSRVRGLFRFYNPPEWRNKSVDVAHVERIHSLSAAVAGAAVLKGYVGGDKDAEIKPRTSGLAHQTSSGMARRSNFIGSASKAVAFRDIGRFRLVCPSTDSIYCDVGQAFGARHAVNCYRRRACVTCGCLSNTLRRAFASLALPFTRRRHRQWHFKLHRFSPRHSANGDLLNETLGN